MKADEPRPTLQQFLSCCRAEFRFLSAYGFQELPNLETGHPDPFRFRMIGKSIELCVHGIDYGSRAHLWLRNRSGQEFFLDQLIQASRAASRIGRRRRPDGQRADIAAAAKALRDFPSVLEGATDALKEGFFFHRAYAPANYIGRIHRRER